ncbi:hypothetical protein [Aeromicrobium chenweiae]|uniref:Uncharacterized protein n=1 Tax=Aeromicrobium chenweiae TaxID=2079793 RepID=A0A2S0WNN2_9ACTN|nr:hypothetical protein [Aeromicrobium chenweiae]AWB92916.1 hypothetical protein C3E78_12270 [Aeromicrobium chenweiae]TGN33911.1 hypothetical protein E4L97_02320 [Aeromicrobium chenweiae]
MTRWPRALLLVPAAVLLAGCPAPQKDELKPDAVDRERVARIAKDPWAAPSSTTLPRQGDGTNGLVTREAGRRETTLLGEDDLPAVRAEVEAAEADGWTLVGAVCSERGRVDEVQLARGETLDDSARAVITTEPEGSRDAPAWRIVVRVYVPHHADRSWPRPDAVRTSATCLADPAAPPVEVDSVADGRVYGPETS